MAQPSFESLKIEAEKAVQAWEQSCTYSRPSMDASSRRLLVLQFAEVILNTRVTMLNEVPNIVASALDKSPK